MSTIKILIFILTLSIISLTGCSKKEFMDIPVENFNFKSDKPGKSIFDKVQWVKIKEKNGITLYMQKNKNVKLNYYKAEKIINSKQGEKIYEKIMNFDKFIKIFPKTIMYKKIKEISKNQYLIYCQANFKPLKNRDYYQLLEYTIEKNDNTRVWTIEKYPLGSYPEKFSEIKGFIRVKNIYSRWKIIEFNNKVKISIENYNNFKLTYSKQLTEPFEKSAIIDVLNKVINYKN